MLLARWEGGEVRLECVLYLATAASGHVVNSSALKIEHEYYGRVQLQ